MAGRIRQEDIATVRERSPIADVIGEYIQLRPAGGGNLKGLCPFHDERTPSFNVTPGKDLYHCFSCGAGGDVIKFVQEIEHLTFTEAVERLAARANVQLRYEQGGYVPGQETGQRRRLTEAHRAAAEFYADRLRNNPDASAGREFLSQRGFELGDAEKFGMGFTMRLTVKDIRLALGIERATGTPSSVSEAVLTAWEAALRELPGNPDHSEIARWLDTS